MNAAKNPVIAVISEAMDYYMQRACLSVEQMFSNASSECHATLVAGYLMAAATIHAGHVQAVPMAAAAGALRAGFKELSAATELMADGLNDCEGALQSIGGALDGVAHAVAADNRPLAEALRAIADALRANGTQAEHDGSKPCR